MSNMCMSQAFVHHCSRPGARQGTLANTRTIRRHGSSGSKSLSRRLSISAQAGERVTMIPAVFDVPHPDKVDTGGEDASMVSLCSDEEGNPGFVTVAVADGVSSWRQKGVDSGAFSTVLVHGTSEKVSADPTADCKDIMAYAADVAKVPGSATFVVASLNETSGSLSLANLGDSGARVIRDGKVAYSTGIQQHAFDQPYQMACDAFVTVDYDTADDAQCEEFQLQDGDWVVLATDGLFDNMYDEEIVEVMGGFNNGSDPYAAASSAARVLVDKAQTYSKDSRRPTPYADAFEAEKEARAKVGGQPKPRIPFQLPFFKAAATGGKLDDITVIAAKVVSLTDPSTAGARKDAMAAAEKAASEAKMIAEKAIAESAKRAEREQRIKDKIRAQEEQFEEKVSSMGPSVETVEDDVKTA